MKNVSFAILSKFYKALHPWDEVEHLDYSRKVVVRLSNFLFLEMKDCLQASKLTLQ